MNHLVLKALLASTSSDKSETITDTVDAVDKLSGTISEYGLAVVIMAVFFIIFLLLVFLILRNNAKMMTHIVKHQDHSNNFEEELLSKLVDSALEAKLGGGVTDKIVNEVKQAVAPIQQSVDSINSAQAQEDAIHKDLVGAYIDVNMAFKDASRSAMDSLNCARVAIYVFHNGNKSMHGLPFFKMSCIHEWTKTNMGRNTLRGKSHVEMPLHLFADFIEDLWKNGVYRAENVDKSIETDISLNEFIAYSKTKALYINAIKDDNDVIAGFVVAEFENEDTFESDDNRNNEVKQVLDKMVMKVSPILTYHHISNKK